MPTKLYLVEKTTKFSPSKNMCFYSTCNEQGHVFSSAGNPEAEASSQGWGDYVNNGDRGTTEQDWGAEERDKAERGGAVSRHGPVQPPDQQPPHRDLCSQLGAREGARLQGEAGHWGG